MKPLTLKFEIPMKDTTSHLTFEKAMESYKTHSPIAKSTLRAIAAHRLIESGSEEVGTSDINHELFSLYRQYGGNYVEAYLEEGYRLDD